MVASDGDAIQSLSSASSPWVRPHARLTRVGAVEFRPVLLLGVVVVVMVAVAVVVGQAESIIVWRQSRSVFYHSGHV